MERPDFYPVRSLIYVDLAKEDYRIHLENWLYRYHIPDSISQFGPYVSKYAFYQALPVPEGGERFGTVRMQMTEHYWLANPNDIHEFVHHKALTEYFPPDVLVWQNNIPDPADGNGSAEEMNFEGDDARATKGMKNWAPFRSYLHSSRYGGKRTSRAKAEPWKTVRTTDGSSWFGIRKVSPWKKEING